jgi:peptidyl-prolyl cis-trans isomerase C
MVFLLLIPVRAICADEAIILKIGDVSFTKTALEQEFNESTGSQNAPIKWEMLPEDAKISFIDSMVRKYLLQDAADREIKADDPRIAILMDKMQRQIRAQLYTEDTLADLVEEEDIEDVYEDMIKHASKPQIYQMLQIIAPSQRSAEAVRQILLSGAPMAKALEADSSLKTSDIELSTQDELFPAVEKAISPLKPGEISAAVKTDFGWHVFMLTSKREGEFPTFEQMRPTISEQMRQEAWQTHLAKMLKKADVRYFDINGSKKPLPWNKK